MNRTQCLVTAMAVILGLSTLAAIPPPKANHHNGQQLLADKIKTNGQHVLDKKGGFTASVEVKNGKVAGLHVNKANKGDVPVKKYKTDKKMALAGEGRYRNASFPLGQDQYVGTTYIGYAYIDDYGVEEIYWFPYDMILDGDTGAIVYVPAQ